jgi:hypothetical protein
MDGEARCGLRGRVLDPPLLRVAYRALQTDFGRQRRGRAISDLKI